MQGAGVAENSRPVILLHGLGRTSASMYLLARRLRRAGLNAECMDYPSTRLTLEAAYEFLREALTKRFPATQIDLVGHSMGGVIARKLCLSTGAPDVRRVVQIGAPNLGSPLADRLGPFWAIRTACGPAINDLGAKAERLPEDPRVTALAGTLSMGPSGQVLHGPSDGVVSVRSAWAGAARRYRVAQMHTLLPASRRVAQQVIEALKAETDVARP